ncbi:hypothetical protein THAOC_10092, partial [Thalassiosira oceanica]
MGPTHDRKQAAAGTAARHSATPGMPGTVAPANQKATCPLSSACPPVASAQRLSRRVFLGASVSAAAFSAPLHRERLLTPGALYSSDTSRVGRPQRCIAEHVCTRRTMNSRTPPPSTSGVRQLDNIGIAIAIAHPQFMMGPRAKPRVGARLPAYGRTRVDVARPISVFGVPVPPPVVSTFRRLNRIAEHSFVGSSIQQPVNRHLPPYQPPYPSTSACPPGQPGLLLYTTKIFCGADEPPTMGTRAIEEESSSPRIEGGPGEGGASTRAASGARRAPTAADEAPDPCYDANDDPTMTAVPITQDNS